MRAKIAKQRNKKHLVQNLTRSRISIPPIETTLQQLLPSRRKWVKLGEKSRQATALNSVDKNIKSLQKTIQRFKESNPDESFLHNLYEFIELVNTSIRDEKYTISPPNIYAKAKDESNKICRPIATFSLLDKIVISLTNKYFTDLFDEYFYEHSYAFRSVQSIDGRKNIRSHHDAIKTIVNYQQRMKGRELFVSECDMKKFYDTVNHTCIKSSFKKLVKKVKKDHPEYYSQDAERIFYRYLECYKFNKNVLPLNKDRHFFEKINIPDGEFGWVKNDFIKKQFYRSFNNAKIGVPQGGALSGLIANIVLDYADKQVLKFADDELLYVRFCDDMLIIHPDREKCTVASEEYKKSLETLKLIPHDFISGLRNTADSFWKSKSKSTYKWGAEDKGGFPWIGFVGYEIHHKGHVRVRKSSLGKEMKKQYDLVNEIMLAVPKSQKRVSNGKIIESAINRLIGMSVGRVTLWNFNSIKNDMCWINGFSELNDNKYTRIQLRRLDSCRSRLIRKLKKKVTEDGSVDESDSRKTQKDRHVQFYGKPYSYYYQVMKNIRQRQINIAQSTLNNR